MNFKVGDKVVYKGRVGEVIKIYETPAYYPIRVNFYDARPNEPLGTFTKFGQFNIEGEIDLFHYKETSVVWMIKLDRYNGKEDIFSDYAHALDTAKAWTRQEKCRTRIFRLCTIVDPSTDIIVTDISL